MPAWTRKPMIAATDFDTLVGKTVASADGTLGTVVSITAKSSIGCNNFPILVQVGPTCYGQYCSDGYMFFENSENYYIKLVE
jgi:hypothetical protein